MISYVPVSLHSRLKSVEECLPHRPPSQCCFVELMPTSVGYFTNKYHGTWDVICYGKNICFYTLKLTLLLQNNTDVGAVGKTFASTLFS